MNTNNIDFQFIFLTLRKLLILIKKNLLIIFILGCLGSSVGFYIASTHRPIYQAESRFIISDLGSNSFVSSLGNLGSLLGGSGLPSVEKIISVIRSQRVIGKVLLSPINVNDNKDLVINHFIHFSKLNEKWKWNTLLANDNFTFRDTIFESFNYSQRKVFKTVLASFIGQKGIVATSFDKKSGIVVLNVSHANEDFAIEVNKLIYNELNLFFQEFWQTLRSHYKFVPMKVQKHLFQDAHLNIHQ